MNYKEILAIYEGSDGNATMELYRKLEAFGPAGFLGMNLFRAHKASVRAKLYRGGNAGGRYKDQAYQKKQWSLDNLAKAMTAHGDGLGLVWGWKRDPSQPVHCWLLYVQLPTGQVSFHLEARGIGPDFAGQWDGIKGAAPHRICNWLAGIMEPAKTEKATT